jgi:hypothetical protein
LFVTNARKTLLSNALRGLLAVRWFDNGLHFG